MNIFKVFTILVSAILFAWPIASNAKPWEEACHNSQWIPHDFNSQGDCVSMIATGEAMVWSVYEDFRFNPTPLNPSPDQYDNNEVWHYRYSVGLDHNPANYNYYTHYMNVDGWEAWVTTDTMPYLPFFGAAPDDEDKDAVLHPASTSLTMVSWRSPIEDRITIVGAFGARQECGDGVVWSVERETPTGVVALVQGPINRGSDEVSSRTEYAVDVRVTVGDFIDFVVDPGPDGDVCDLTGMHLTIVSKSR